MMRGAVPAVVLMAVGMSGAADVPVSELVDQAWFKNAPPLPEPAGETIRAASVGAIYKAARNVQPGGTIMVADGHYMMTHTLYLKKDKVTVRSESGDRSKVVLDFEKSRHGEGVAVSYASDVTIADLTVQNVYWNGIKINSNHNVHRATVYNVVSHNVWQRHIKGPKVPDRDGKPQWVEGCRVQYCLFYNDRPKRRGDDPYEDRNGRFRHNYIGGIDIMGADGWVISDNVFVGIHGATRECRGAIFMWQNSKNCVIERNVMIDCDTGICLGNSSGRGERRHATGFIVRNNFITRCPESNLFASHTRDCVIANNTVHDPSSRMRRLLRVIYANDGLVVKNNLFSGPAFSTKNVEGEITVENNLVKPATDFFVDPAKGDLHLKRDAADAIDKAVILEQVKEDWDGAERGEKPDLGADEME